MQDRGGQRQKATTTTALKKESELLDLHLGKSKFWVLNSLYFSVLMSDSCSASVHRLQQLRNTVASLRNFDNSASVDSQEMQISFRHLCLLALRDSSARGSSPLFRRELEALCSLANFFAVNGWRCTWLCGVPSADSRHWVANLPCLYPLSIPRKTASDPTSFPPLGTCWPHCQAEVTIGRS